MLLETASNHTSKGKMKVLLLLSLVASTLAANEEQIEPLITFFDNMVKSIMGQKVIEWKWTPSLDEFVQDMDSLNQGEKVDPERDSFLSEIHKDWTPFLIIRIFNGKTIRLINSKISSFIHDEVLAIIADRTEKISTKLYARLCEWPFCAGEWSESAFFNLWGTGEHFHQGSDLFF